MSKHPDVAVIGGGIIGLTAAYFLAKAGFAVEVLDRGDLGMGASWAGAGIIPPGNPDGAVEPIDRLRAFGSTQFQAFSSELRELTCIDNGYLHCGGIEFLQPHDTDVLGVWEQEGKSRVGIESYYTGRQRLEFDPYRDFSKPYVIFGIMGERRVHKHAKLFLNLENLTNVRQTRWDSLLRPNRGPDGRWTVDDGGERENRAFPYTGRLPLRPDGPSLPVGCTERGLRAYCNRDHDF